MSTEIAAQLRMKCIEIAAQYCNTSSEMMKLSKDLMSLVLGELANPG